MGSNKLIFMCAFGDNEYYKMMELTLVSIKLFSKTEGANFLVYTCKDFESRLITLSKNLEISIDIVIVNDIKSAHDAASYRLKIFEYPKINLYNKILYIDIDIVVQGNLLEWFDLCTEDKLYAVKDQVISYSCGLGSTLFDFSKIDKNTPGINTGVLLFQNSSYIRQLFDDVNDHIAAFKLSGNPLPTCYEQPFVNFHAMKYGLYDINILSNYVFLTHNGWKGHEVPISPLTNKLIFINHFVGTYGKFKLTKEYYHMTYLLESYKNIVQINGLFYPLIIRKQYVWGNGRIVFEVNGILITTWSRTGTYEILNSHVIKASWLGFNHILIFNNDYTNFVSIRISDIEIITDHKIDTNLLDMIPEPSKLEPIAPTGSKNLLYFCVFHNRGYFDLLDILLNTLKKSSNLDIIDLLVFTSAEFEPVVKTLSLKFNLSISIHVCNFQTQHEAGCARIFIFDYPRINEYAKILYMDCDIVIQGDISKLFILPIEEKVYAKKEYAIGGEGHGGWFFDFSRIDEKTDAINSGVLLFRNSTKIQSVFKDIRTHIDRLKKTETLLPLCMDQSFIIYHLFKNGACDNELISSYVYLAEFTQPPVLTDGGLLICHFVWPIGNTGHKMNRMLQHKELLDADA